MNKNRSAALRRANFFVVVALMLLLVVGCTEEEEPEFVIPTPGLFEVLTATPRPEPTSTPEPTATPAPTSTPAPTPTPTPVPTSTPVPLVERPFPAHIDPDFVSERPTDEEIFEGWTEYLMDAEVRLVGDTVGTHYCQDGTMWFPASDAEDYAWWAFEWNVKHPPAVSSSEWQTVFNGAFNRMFSRKNGKTVLPQAREDLEVIVGDSWKCAESLVWSQADQAPVSLWLISDVHALDDGSVVFIHNGRMVFFNPLFNSWNVNEREDVVGLWRLRYLPKHGIDGQQHGFVGFKNDEMWFIDHLTGSIKQGPSLNASTSIFWLVSNDDGEIYVGRGTEAEFDEIYSPDSNAWTKVDPKLREEDFLWALDSGSALDSSLQFSNVVVLDDGRYLMGDPTSEPPWDMWTYDLEENLLTEVAESSDPRFAGKLLKLPDGEVLLYSGRYQDGFVQKPATTYEIYDVESDSWSRWEPGVMIENGWVMSDAWVADRDGTILGSFTHLTEPGKFQFGVFDPETSLWTYFPHPPGTGSGITVIPMSHKRIMVLKEVDRADSITETWIIKLP